MNKKKTSAVRSVEAYSDARTFLAVEMARCVVTA